MNFKKGNRVFLENWKTVKKTKKTKAQNWKLKVCKLQVQGWKSVFEFWKREIKEKYIVSRFMYNLLL